MKQGNALTVVWTGVGVFLGSLLAIGRSDLWLIVIPTIAISLIGYVKWSEINQESNP